MGKPKSKSTDDAFYEEVASMPINAIYQEDLLAFVNKHKDKFGGPFGDDWTKAKTAVKAVQRKAIEALASGTEKSIEDTKEKYLLLRSEMLEKRMHEDALEKQEEKVEKAEAKAEKKQAARAASKEKDDGNKLKKKENDDALKMIDDKLTEEFLKKMVKESGLCDEAQIKKGLSAINKTYQLDKAKALSKAATLDDDNTLGVKLSNVKNCIAFSPPDAMAYEGDGDLKRFYDGFNAVVYNEKMEADEQVTSAAPKYLANEADVLALADAVEPYAIGLIHTATKHGMAHVGVRKANVARLNAGDIMLPHTLYDLPFGGMMTNLLIETNLPNKVEE